MVVALHIFVLFGYGVVGTRPSAACGAWPPQGTRGTFGSAVALYGKDKPRAIRQVVKSFADSVALPLEFARARRNIGMSDAASRSRKEPPRRSESGRMFAKT